MIDSDDHPRVLALRELLPSAVRRTMKMIGAKPFVKVENRTVPNEWADELLSVAHELLCEKFPDANEWWITCSLPRLLKAWWLDNRNAVTAVKSAANRKRRQRGKPTNYGEQIEFDLSEAMWYSDTESCPLVGRYAPICDEYLYRVAAEDIEQVLQTYDYLYVFVAEDEIDRAIIKYLKSQFDPDNPETLLALEKLSQQNIANAIDVPRSTVGRRLRAMKQRLNKSNL